VPLPKEGRHVGDERLLSERHVARQIDRDQMDDVGAFAGGPALSWWIGSSRS
jgi:hypothetical protein